MYAKYNKTAKINKKAQKGGKDYEQKALKLGAASILALGAGAAVVSKRTKG